jgi:hypothetical protein
MTSCRRGFEVEPGRVMRGYKKLFAPSFVQVVVGEEAKIQGRVRSFD